MTKHYLDNVGTDFILDTGIDLTNVTEQSIHWRDPAKLEGSWSADLYDSYSDLAGLTGTYLLKHKLVSSDITVAGEWRFQAYIGSVTGTWLGETVKIQLYDDFE